MALLGVIILALTVLIPARIILGVLPLVAVAVLCVLPVATQGSGSIQIIASVVLAGVTVMGLLRASKRVAWNASAVMMVLLFTLALLTSLANDGDLFYATSAIVGVPLMLAASSMNTQEKNIFWGGTIWIGIAASCVAVYETYVAKALLFHPDAVHLTANVFSRQLIRSEVTFWSPLVLGFFLLLAFLLLINKGITPARLMGALILVAGMIATGSASIVAVAAAATIYTIFRRLRIVARINLVLFGGALIAIVLMSSTLFSGLFEFFTGDKSTHRAASLAAVPDILSLQDGVSVVFGSGWASAEALYTAGIMENVDFYAADNQFVTTLIETGIIGLLLLVGALISGWRNAPRTMLPALAGLTVMFFSFDVLGWALPASLFLMILCTRENKTIHDDPLDAPQGKARLV